MLESERVVVQAPMSYTGATRRLWRLTKPGAHPALRWGVLIPLVVCVLVVVWVLISCWYVAFGLFLLPYRLLRRGARKRRVERLRHQELLEATRRSDG